MIKFTDAKTALEVSATIDSEGDACFDLNGITIAYISADTGMLYRIGGLNESLREAGIQVGDDGEIRIADLYNIDINEV